MLFFQTGYLTIFDWDNGYRLRIANQEVQSVLTLLFVPEYTGRSSSAIDNDLNRLRTIESWAVDSAIVLLRAQAEKSVHENFGKCDENVKFAS